MAHPSFKNPSITEAVCEIHFRLADDEHWSHSLFGEFFKRIQDEYPSMEPGTEVGLEIEVGPHGFGQKVLPPRQKMRFRHADRPLVIQLAQGILTINVMKPYPGWHRMQEDVIGAWTKARETFRPSAITRVGLRYINRIEREDPEEAAQEWLRPGEYLPPGVLRSNRGFFLRVEAHLDPSNRLIVTLGDDRSASAGDHGAIVFDIDRIVNEEVSTTADALRGKTTALHEDVWQVFSESLTDRLRQRLEG